VFSFADDSQIRAPLKHIKLILILTSYYTLSIIGDIVNILFVKESFFIPLKLYLGGRKQMNEFHYYTQQEAEQHAYYSIPKELFTNSNYKHISTDAKLLYGLLRDRNQLSIKNNWFDTEGHIYIIFTREEAMEILGFKKDYITKIFKELNEVKLIKDVRQGLNKPNIIYVGKITFENKSYQLNTVLPQSGIRQKRNQESVNTATSNTNNNNIISNMKKISPSIRPDFVETRKETKVEVSNFIKNTDDRQTDSITFEAELKSILNNAQTELYTTKLFIESVVRKLYTDGNMPYVLKMGLSHKDIQDRLKLLTNRAIDTALIKLKNVKSNKEVYFAKCLLTAIVEIDLDDYIQDIQEE
jgi:hypothetical protein